VQSRVEWTFARCKDPDPEVFTGVTESSDETRQQEGDCRERRSQRSYPALQTLTLIKKKP